jgi:hypothetical protein
MIDIILFLFGWFFMKYIFSSKQKEETIKDPVITQQVLIEKIQDQYYAWKMFPKEEFVTQSKSLEEVMHNLSNILEDKRIEIKTNEEIEWQLKNLKFIKD